MRSMRTNIITLFFIVLLIIGVCFNWNGIIEFYLSTGESEEKTKSTRHTDITAQRLQRGARQGNYKEEETRTTNYPYPRQHLNQFCIPYMEYVNTSLMLSGRKKNNIFFPLFPPIKHTKAHWSYHGANYFDIFQTEFLGWHHYLPKCKSMQSVG